MGTKVLWAFSGVYAGGNGMFRLDKNGLGLLEFAGDGFFCGFIQSVAR